MLDSYTCEMDFAPTAASMADAVVLSFYPRQLAKFDQLGAVDRILHIYLTLTSPVPTSKYSIPFCSASHAHRPNVKSSQDDEDLLKDPLVYRRMIGKLLYLTITRPNLGYFVNRLSQFLTKPQVPHL